MRDATPALTLKSCKRPPRNGLRYQSAWKIAAAAEQTGPIVASPLLADRNQSADEARVKP
jgi:hypothetical protein